MLEETVPLTALMDDFDPVEYFDEIDDEHQELDPDDEDDSAFEDYVEERQHLYQDIVALTAALKKTLGGRR